MLGPYIRLVRTITPPTHILRGYSTLRLASSQFSLASKSALQRPNRRFTCELRKLHSISDMSANHSQTAHDPSAVSAASNAKPGPSDCSATSSRFPNFYPSLNPIDVYREYIADHLASITGVEASEVYTKLQWTQTQDKGDLTLPVPALRIKGKKPDQHATEWVEKASSLPSPMHCMN